MVVIDVVVSPLLVIDQVVSCQYMFFPDYKILKSFRIETFHSEQELCIYKHICIKRCLVYSSESRD